MHAEFDAKRFLQTISERPGVYQFFDAENKILYVGKAKNLRKRLSSYFNKSISHIKTQRLISQADHIETIITGSETEALLLECNLIKEHLPRYNILMRDDKSYPYITLSKEEYPRLDSFRGHPGKNLKVFGPYPSTTAVRASLHLLQKIFKVRSCENSVFKHRTRPCLQYQINRCSAPCVGYISAEEYHGAISYIEKFLSGKRDEVIEELNQKMELAAQQLDFEKAAEYRDSITSLRQVQEQQAVSKGNTNADVFAIIAGAFGVKIARLEIRHGKMISSQIHHPKHDLDFELSEILDSFISQYYFSNNVLLSPPEHIVTNILLPNHQLLQSTFQLAYHKKVIIQVGTRQDKAKWIAMAIENITHATQKESENMTKYSATFSRLRELLNMNFPLTKIACFDISHTVGQLTVAAAVVFTDQGADKTLYRRFNIENIQAGDDYAAMKQVLSRYLIRQQQENTLPELLLIDGGKGQIHQAYDCLNELNIHSVSIVGIAKGEGRRPGKETLWLARDKQLILKSDDACFLLLQEIRDEAHRFAITGHRQRRGQAFKISQLEHIPGIGPARRQALLKRFGGLQSLISANIDEIAKIEGIDLMLAKRIYECLHS